jgi:predicted tellurium resistance membrane protein TerC
MEVFLNPDAWIALLTLTFLEIILGIDNIIFISIVTGKLPEEKRKKATQLGLFLAMFMRIALLFGITLLITMKAPWFSFDFGWFSADITGQALILLLGGLFLIYKSTKEIHEKVDHKGEEEKSMKSSAAKSFGSVILQILLIDLIFSVDSILTAVGMTNGVPGALVIMVTAVVISVGVMMLFAVPVGNFVNANPSIQILGLAFLILIGFMLITESMHLSHAQLAGQYVGAVPKGYLYFAIAFSLTVEFINMKMRKKK